MGALIDWMLLPLKRYAEFGGRSSRREFWSFFLLNLAVTMVLLGPLYIRMIAGLTGSRSGNGAGTPPEPGALAMGLGLEAVCGRLARWFRSSRCQCDACMIAGSAVCGIWAFWSPLPWSCVRRFRLPGSS